MLKVRCIISPENEKNVMSILDQNGIMCDRNSEVVLVEKGLKEPDSGLIIKFAADRIELLSETLSKLNESDKPGPSLLIGSRHNTFQTIPPDEILFFRADGNYVYAVTAAAEYEVKQKLYELEERFSGGSFIRTGKSFIVNILKVQEIIPWFGSRLLLRITGSEQRIEVSRNYLKSFKAYLEM